jgi:hypothetical protein
LIGQPAADEAQRPQRTRNARTHSDQQVAQISTSIREFGFTSTLLRRVGRWRKRARWVWCKLNAVPKTVRIVVITATILRAIELTAVFLDRNITAILAHRRKTTANAREKHELAAIIHLCGASPAKGFAHRGFHPTAGERCGAQQVATYLAQINAMTREFLRVEAER